MMAGMLLVGVFVIAMLMRLFPARYGFYLNEFDPYYDFKAANFIVNSFDQSWNAGQGGFPGLLHYFSWIDYTTWFPEGRAVASTSQDGLQFAGALSYLFFRNIFGLQYSLYDYLVLFPVFVGALTSVVFYYLVKRIAGEAGGLFAALMIAVSPPLIERGNLGWFKSEPLCIFLFAIAAYLFLTLLDSPMSNRQRIFRALFAGLISGYANTAWGGGEYFTIAFAFFFVVMPFLNFDVPNLSIVALLFAAGDIFGSAIFPRPGVEIVTNPVGFALIGGTIFLVIGQWMRTWVKPADYRWTMVKVLLGFGLIALTVLSFGLLSTVSRRYLSTILPWTKSSDPLVESVAEQVFPLGSTYFSSYLVLLFLGIFGAYIAFKRKSPTIGFALVIGLSSLYISAAFSRLLVYSSIALAILGGIGFAEVLFSILKPSGPTLVKRKPTYSSQSETRAVYSIALIAMLAFPASIFWIPNPVSCTGTNVLCDQSPADYGVTISNGGTVFSHTQVSDWFEALNWINSNTPTNAVIISWWDYGYWVNVMGNRTVVADNATLNETRIADIGQMFMQNVTQGAATALAMGHGRPTYVLMFLTGSEITLSGSSYYVLQLPSGGGFTPGGGDESKKQWFIRISGQNESRYLWPTPDDFNLTPTGLQTVFGQMLPFEFAGYYDIYNSSATVTHNYALDSSTGAPPLQLYYAPYFFQLNGGTSPFQIVFHSSSLDSPLACGSQVSCFSAVVIYKVT
ncbi:MAG TPA: STT3 domain-containing protein [Nitrososphaerales archaeon]|nr:STT3 domain-containing protein [Nitrososphaerales archaeon]